MKKPTTTIVITSKNRKKELAKCIDSCLNLKDVTEILVFDDGSTDGTYDFIRNRYSKIRIYRTESSIGLINARTYCASLAKGEIIFSVDDDCIFQGTETISEILTFFTNDKIAVVTIPIINLHENNKLCQKGKGNKNEVYICSQFMGGAHAIRKDVFLKFNGYYNNLVRQEEETELSMRLFNKGYVIRIGNCIAPILHNHSSLRNEKIISFYRARNQFILNYKMAPLLIIPFVLFKQGLQTFIYEFNKKNVTSNLKGNFEAFYLVITLKIKRTPLSYKKYYEYKRLRNINSKRIYF